MSSNLSITDAVAWIWYYDRQGCIQSQGFNFVDDFPTFLVLLYAFQRLELEQWGLNAQLDDRVRRAHSGTFERNKNNQEIVPAAPWAITIGSTKLIADLGSVLHSTLTLIGRGTVTFQARVKGSGKMVVVKIYWPEEVRKNERDIILAAREAGGNNPDITDHLPTVIDWADFDFRTGDVRKALDLEYSKAGVTQNRVLRAIVFTRLDAITTLSGGDFVQAWLECVRCEHHNLK